MTNGHSGEYGIRMRRQAKVRFRRTIDRQDPADPGGEIHQVNPESETYLAGKHNQLNHFASIDDLVTDEKLLSSSERNAIEHHLLNLRAAIARELWSREIYVGRSVLDECVLGAAKAGGGNIAARANADLAQAGSERPGFVLYPLTSFGMQMSPIFQLPRRRSAIRA